MKEIANMRWERLDVPGIDECRLYQTDSGWHLAGRAQFVDQGQKHDIEYTVDSAENWNTWRAEIKGTANHLIQRKSGKWFLDGKPQEDIAAGITQIDFGFTPATNYTQLKQMGLDVGEEADCIVAWFDLGEPELVYLHQVYGRIAENKYDYDSPSYRYHEVLTIAKNGFVTDYPYLWKS